MTNLCYVLYLRVFLALSEDPKDRGTIVAQGGGKVSERFQNQYAVESMVPSDMTTELNKITVRILIPQETTH